MTLSELIDKLDELRRKHGGEVRVRCVSFDNEPRLVEHVGMTRDERFVLIEDGD